MSAIADLREEFENRLARAQDGPALEDLRILFLGRKGHLADQFKQMGSLGPEDRRTTGAALNELKIHCERRLKEALGRMASSAPAGGRGVEQVDVTLPGRSVHAGSAHPLITTQNDICEIFRLAGFDIETGPEVETDWYNFGALNVPVDHPARDMHDTFYLASSTPPGGQGNKDPDAYLLRTHTSPVQIHVMERQKPPLRVIAPGRVYRRDDDISHTPMFHQVEGLWVDEGVTLRDLKGLLEYFAKRMFGESTGTRFRPSFFPFTEPSLEMDVSCVICGGSRQCRTCKSSGWLEILGAGMVHPEVFRAVGIDPGKVTGLAFGMGVERIAMLRYAIDDIHQFYDNDLRFLADLGAGR